MNARTRFIRMSACAMIVLPGVALPLAAAPPSLNNIVPKYSGRYVERSDVSGRSATSTNIIDFTVQQSGCSWRIDLVPVAKWSEAVKEDELIVYQSDGRYIYKRHDRGGHSMRAGGVTIYDEPYPASQDLNDWQACLQELQVIWMGYAAGCVMPAPSGRAHDPFLVNMDEFAKPPEDIAYRFVGDGSVAAPRSLELFRRYDRVSDDKAPVLAKGVWTRTFIGGEPCANFHFNRYWTQLEMKPFLIEVCDIECVITNVTQESFALDLPGPGTPCPVADRRASKDGYALIRYTADAGIPDVDSEQFKRIRDRSPKLSLADEAQLLSSGGAWKPAPVTDTRELAGWFLYLSPLVTLFGLQLAYRTLRRRHAPEMTGLCRPLVIRKL